MVLVKLRRDYFIPIPYHTLTSVLQYIVEEKHSGHIGAEFASICRLAEAVYQHRANVCLSELKRGFLHVSPVSWQEVEDSFIDVLVGVIVLGNYELFTDTEWDTAVKENFELSATLEMDWSQLDSSCLGRFLERAPEIKKTSFRHASRILVFHRGIGQVTATKRFLIGKVNLLLSYIVDAVCCRRSQDDALPEGGDSADESCGGPEVMFVERQTLRHVLPSAFAVLKNLLSKTTVTEPVFKDLVTLHFQQPSQQTSPDTRPVPVLKAFHSIPMADVEVILPNKRILFPPLELAKVCVAFFMLSIFVYRQFLSVGESSAGMGRFALTFVAMLVIKIVQVFQSAKKAKDDFLVKMAETLYEKSVGSDTAVVDDLIASMEEQEVKELILTYWALLQSSGPKTGDELGSMIHEMLHREFRTTINFEVDGGLEKLRADGLACKVVRREDGASCWECVPLGTAVRILRRIQHDHTEQLAKTDKEITSRPEKSRHLRCLTGCCRSE
eukprot:TRINITY_DN37795_c0_g1_i2.p1 TRINITY_DN37795_c0_g1~~TRINITY_DN37795_c0_g1_i2.p1  ORF type:complete len:499 (+),score=85.43 TRINITY_DN37795_c0_g1_i2:41-1537(+)